MGRKNRKARRIQIVEMVHNNIVLSPPIDFIVDKSRRGATSINSLVVATVFVYYVVITSVLTTTTTVGVIQGL